MRQRLFRLDSFCWVQFQHFVKHLNGLTRDSSISNELVPRDSFFLELVWHQNPVSHLISDRLDFFGSEDQGQGDQVADHEILDFGGVIEGDDGVSLHQEGEHDHTYGPDVDG